MFSPWVLLSILFTPARAFPVSRHHPPDGPGSLEKPTCEELQEFWKIVKQSIGMEPVTNEIPAMPPKVLDRILMETSIKGKHSKTHTKYPKEALSNRFDSVNHFSKGSRVMPSEVLPKSLLLPQSQMPSEPEEKGIFGEFHERLDQPSSSNHHQTNPEVSGSGWTSSVPLGDKKYGEREYFIPQWGLPEEVDTFGSFVDFDIVYPHLARTPKGTTGEWSDLSSVVACDVLMNSDCIANEQCFCKEGWNKLQCIHGKCLNSDQNYDNLEKYGTWHDGPIPELQLRLLAMPRAKRYRSIFM